MENVRFYGRKPYTVAVVHGGPGAPGEMAPVARELASLAGVLEPLQTKDSVEGQVIELGDVLRRHGRPPLVLVGFSWGATLGFIVAARFPELAGRLVLIGGGPFEEKYADNITPDRLARLSEDDRLEAIAMIDIIEGNAGDAEKDRAMARLAGLYARADAFDPLPHRDELLEVSEAINRKVWNEARQLRMSGKLLEMGKRIDCPVLAIHGDHDPHLAAGVREPLSQVVRDFRFVLLEKCGHEPWTEKHARDRFYEVLRNELAV
jgi:pimeloyl-ACP methyl ester carboxylesterase